MCEQSFYEKRTMLLKRALLTFVFLNLLLQILTQAANATDKLAHNWWMNNMDTWIKLNLYNNLKNRLSNVTTQQHAVMKRDSIKQQVYPSRNNWAEKQIFPVILFNDAGNRAQFNKHAYNLSNQVKNIYNLTNTILFQTSAQQEPQATESNNKNVFINRTTDVLSIQAKYRDEKFGFNISEEHRKYERKVRSVFDLFKCMMVKIQFVCSLAKNLFIEQLLDDNAHSRTLLENKNMWTTARKKSKLKKKFKKLLIPLLIAYKLKFLTLIPVLIGGLTLLVGTTGLAGFFFALFTAVMSLKITGQSHHDIMVKQRNLSFNGPSY